MKTKTPTSAAIATALQPLHQAIYTLVSDKLKLSITNLYETLTKDGWDRQVNYSYPIYAKCKGRIDYQIKIEQYDLARKWTVTDSKYSRSFNDPDPCHPLSEEELVKRIDQEATRVAGDTLRSYAAKMTAKVDGFAPGRTISEVSYSGHSDPWSHSFITVKFQDGGEDLKMRTKMIVNCSPLGKLFNQFPTTRC